MHILERKIFDYLSSYLKNLKAKSSLGQVAQLVRESFQYAKVAGSFSGQGTYKNQLMNV